MALVESIQLVKTVPCLAEPGKIIVIGRPSRAIDGLLPLVAAVAPSVIAFNPVAGQLTLRRQPGLITFYADKVMITQVTDTAEGLELLEAIRDLLNQCWAQRDTIEPVTTVRRRPRPLDVWELLPQTNCRQCGEATCLAFACALLLNRQTVADCRPLMTEAQFTQRRAQLGAVMSSEAELPLDFSI
ncbi:MAG: (Fe-S)-binding protein [Chloroflexota bacterium]